MRQHVAATLGQLGDDTLHTLLAALATASDALGAAPHDLPPPPPRQIPPHPQRS